MNRQAATLSSDDFYLFNEGTHRRIYDKLGVANRLELFAYAHKHGLTKHPS